MANKYRYCGEAFHWDFSGWSTTAGFTGIELPMQGGSANQFTRVVAGDQGQTINGNYFTDTDYALYLVFGVYWQPPIGDVYPVYTGYAGQKRSVSIGVEWDYTGIPTPQNLTLVQNGPNIWHYMQKVFPISPHLSTYWPSKLGRYTLTYYDNGISGYKAILNGVRAFWYHYV